MGVQVAPSASTVPENQFAYVPASVRAALVLFLPPVQTPYTAPFYVRVPFYRW